FAEMGMTTHSRVASPDDFFSALDVGVPSGEPDEVAEFFSSMDTGEYPQVSQTGELPDLDAILGDTTPPTQPPERTPTGSAASLTGELPDFDDLLGDAVQPDESVDEAFDFGAML